MEILAEMLPWQAQRQAEGTGWDKMLSDGDYSVPETLDCPETPLERWGTLP
jgi:hypothetical protein